MSDQCLTTIIHVIMTCKIHGRWNPLQKHIFLPCPLSPIILWKQHSSKVTLACCSGTHVNVEYHIVHFWELLNAIIFIMFIGVLIRWKCFVTTRNCLFYHSVLKKYPNYVYFRMQIKTNANQFMHLQLLFSFISIIFSKEMGPSWSW